MNYLAHLYLAGPSTDLITGGFIGDSVRGDVLQQLPPTIQDGVLLHRAIDRFTDHHPVVRSSVARMRQRFGRYATVVADVFYDHFLARDFSHYHDQPLSDYATSIAALLGKHVDIFPERSRRFYRYMVANNVLVSYANVSGIDKVLARMAERTRFISHMDQAGEELQHHYTDYDADFGLFFPELCKFASAERAIRGFR